MCVRRIGLKIPNWIQLAIGVFLLLFGVRWMAKAVARQAGLKALHDEAAEFAETRARLARGDWHAAWLIGGKNAKVEFAKAGFAKIVCDDPPRKGTGTLLWLVTPQFLAIG